MTKDFTERWSSVADEDISKGLIEELSNSINDDLWVAAACSDRVLDNLEAQRCLLELGIRRTEMGIQRIRDFLTSLGEEVPGLQTDAENFNTYFAEHEDDAHLCRIRSTLLERLHRLDTYGELIATAKNTKGVEERDGWEDDPWADDNAEAGPSTISDSPSVSFVLSLSVFLTESIGHSCLLFASQANLNALDIVRKRHAPEYFPYRLQVLSRIPLFIDPTRYRDMLPAVDAQSGKELQDTVHSFDGNDDFDFALSTLVQEALARRFGQEQRDEKNDDALTRTHEELLSMEDILGWYRERVESILSSGIADNALSLVQHGISRGVFDLDGMGEDLSLISRLVYDAAGQDPEDFRPIGVLEWSSLEPREVIDLYLEHSTPETIVNDVKKLVFPYLFVLESRCERAGKPDLGLTKRYLQDLVLRTSLANAVPIFDASKPTLIASQRLIADDEDLARLALACLYGSSSTDEWSRMSRIFECLPAWSMDYSDDDGEEADTTVSSLGAFLEPTIERPHTSPSDLIVFFKPLPARSLTRALDILDIHLESGEILSRWGVGVPLRWFLQSYHNEAQQRAWAAKMARQANAPEGDLDSEDIWLSLLEDMLKLSRPGDAYTSSAFGTLSGDDVRKIFFKGLLSSGRFDIAKRIAQPRHGERLLPSDVIESICLDCSHEFYDNSNSGNYNFGDMKLAYDCLSVASQTPSITKERNFIEATSRISSFNVQSRPGVALLPIEIRLTKDRLTLLSRILTSNDSAYKHIEVLLELVHKLGYRDESGAVAEAKTLAMVANAALQAEDFERAFGACERMITIVTRLRQKSTLSGDSELVREAMDVCWVACFQLGRQSDVEFVERKVILLGRALELCPEDKIMDVLPAWQKLEVEQAELRKKKLAERRAMRQGDTKTRRGRGVGSLSSRLQDSLGHMPSPALPSASAFASNTFNRVAAALPFGMHGPGSIQDPSSADDRSRSRSPDVQAQARHALRRGVGWLIGAEEGEL